MTTYEWVLVVTSLAFLLALALCFLDRSQRREVAELRARLDRIDPPPERGRHRKTSTGSTAVSLIKPEPDFDTDGGDD